MLTKHTKILKEQYLHPFLITDFMQAPPSPCVYLIYAIENHILHLSYIGASRIVRGRMYQQKAIALYRRKKIPHSIYIIPVREEQLLHTETFLIKKLRPSLNVAHNRR